MTYFSTKYMLLGRKKKFFDNLDRSASMVNILSGGKMITNDQRLEKDIGYYSIVTAVGAVDELIASTYSDLAIGFLLGQLDPPGRVTFKIPAMSATLLLDSGIDYRDNYIPNQFLSLFIESMYKNFRKNNYQSIESISRAIAELGLLKLKKILDTDVYEKFLKNFPPLVERRHVMVHQLMMPQNNLSNLEEESLISKSSCVDILELDCLRDFGKGFIDGIIRYVKS
jgi:hypothetical protein